jgi:N6-L-threonylcarbamoyladenine synthase
LFSNDFDIILPFVLFYIMPTILAIESSCDDTSAAIIKNGVVLSNCVTTQETHRLYGGVVPEIASRAHQANIVPVVDLALKKADTTLEDLDAVAFTRGPGLMGSLLVGVSFAKALGLSLDIPLIAVNHMEAHVAANFAEAPLPSFPFLCLTVSGGHTQIVLVKDFLDQTVIGNTIDDAAGEAFDKTGKLLGLEYPAGPLIDKYAQLGNPIFKFNEPQIPDYNFSFSGLKTSILYFLKKQIADDEDFIQKNLYDICASVQATIINILIKKISKAAKEYKIKNIAIAGGVSANSGLREALVATGKKYGWQTFIPDFQYCTDNAGMIAIVAHHKFLSNDFCDQSVTPLTRSF